MAPVLRRLICWLLPVVVSPLMRVRLMPWSASRLIVPVLLSTLPLPIA